MLVLGDTEQTSREGWAPTHLGDRDSLDLPGQQNELADARLVADYLGTDHHELELSFVDETVDLEDLVWYLDEPLADLSSLGFLALCELAVKDAGRQRLRGGYNLRKISGQRLPGL